MRKMTASESPEFEKGDDEEANDDEEIEADESCVFDEHDEETMTLKRAHSNEDNEGEPQKKAKKLGKELFRPPTAEEMNHLRETQNLFQSNLFRLQIEEIMAEIKVKEKYKNYFQSWFESLEKLLMGLKKCKEIQVPRLHYNYCYFKLGDTSWLKKHNIKLPISVNLQNFKKSFQFLPPSRVSVIGSFAAKCGLGRRIGIDVAVEMPQECFLRSDYQNQNYLLKRALYLSHIAKVLQDWDLKTEMKFSTMENDPMKPVLQVVPSGPLGLRATVTFYIVGAEDSFKLKSLSPTKVNIKSSWYCDTSASEEDDTPTPRYNRSIAVDLLMLRNEQLRTQHLEGNKSLCEGIMLLRVWLKLRGLDQGYGCFSGYLMSMFVIYLTINRRINKIMSSYQVVRNTWIALSQANWTQDGISLCPGADNALLSINDFHLVNEVVFVDFSGHINLCGNMSRSTFLTLKSECVRALACLDNPNINSFQALFLTQMPFYQQYDHLISFVNIEALRKAEEKISRPEWKRDVAGPWLAYEEIVNLLKKGLGSRVSHIATQVSAAQPWSVDCDPPDPRSQSLVIGLLLDPDGALSLIDKGPAANTHQAVEFRTFWGDRSELRRFRDGTVCEAVVWSNRTLAQRRLLCRDVVLYLAQMHLGIDHSCLVYVADQFDTVLRASSGEEGALAITKATDSLCRELMQLEDLPLSISAVQGASSCIRYADPFPPKPLDDSNSVRFNANTTFFGKPLAPVSVVATLGLSSKWPDDLQAVRRIKAAFYLKICQVLKDQCQLLSRPYTEYLDILKDGFVFRLHIYHAREISLLKESTNAQGQLRYKDTEESLALELQNVHLPKLTASLHGLHMTHSAFGPASCLAKRWIAAHHLLGDTLMPDICVELIMASMFLNPEPFAPTFQPQVAFMRFLQKLAARPWLTESFIVNFNYELSKQEIWDMESKFNSDRDNLPPLIIATPDARSGTTWTRKYPIVPILNRISTLAKSSINIVSENLLQDQSWDPKEIFRTPLHIFDILIILKRSFTSEVQAIEFNDEVAELPIHPPTNNKFPVGGFDVVQCYLRDLREAHDEYALFTHDQYGGCVVGVLLRPDARQTKHFKVSHIAGQCPKEQKLTTFDVAAFVDDLKIMGNGLVESIQIENKSLESILNV